MRTPTDVRTSKFLSLVRRHDPARVGITLDAGGWVAVPVLLDALAAHPARYLTVITES
ncbi:hypothetical protein HC031_02440 [Planosporangium thailandense]|uniref:Uncharacterized protein n=1 Tax=Planosporangium thailandense TaxID=765197 RepID=A0ABX0XRR2_9ACTN|nr:RNA 2'-phosphotransferase [Planosporangium thailandense]NJC68587.1 hypothetical protein [Planosporangium thailandense]